MSAAAAATSHPILERLRDATRAQHEALDAAVELTTLEQYQRFLVGSFAAVAFLERRIGEVLGGPVDERSQALHGDLSELGLTAPDPVDLALPSTDFAFGAAYVMEGSSLGGLVIASRLDPAITATRYLRLRGKHTAEHWRQFLGRLEREVAEVEGCIAGARAAFDHYHRAFVHHGVIS